MNKEPEFLLKTDEFVDVLNDIGEIVGDDFSEDEVQMVFLNEGYFQLLGYERIGTDLKSEYSVPSGFVDYITTGSGSTTGGVRTVVYEFKSPERSLNNHVQQLKQYIDDTGSKFGVLTNGVRFQLYQNGPIGLKEILNFKLNSATETEASTIILFLGYWSIEEQNIKSIAEKTAIEVADLLPDDFHIQFSEPSIEQFSKYLARYLKREFQK